MKGKPGASEYWARSKQGLYRRVTMQQSSISVVRSSFAYFDYESNGRTVLHI
jgi:hypothetical protein